MVRRWGGGMGSVGQVVGVERRAMGDTSDRDLLRARSLIELDLSGGVGSGCSAKQRGGKGDC